MKTYQQHFEDLIKDYYYASMHKKLRKNELSILADALNELADIEPNEREMIINRYYLDQKREQTKNYRIIQELLASANSRAYRERYPERFKRNFKFAYEK